MHDEVYGVLEISTTSPPPHSAGCDTCLLLVSASVTALVVYALMVLIVFLVLMVFPVPTSTATEVYKNCHAAQLITQGSAGSGGGAINSIHCA